jgi:penicillin amidase
LRERPADWFDPPRTFDGVLRETLCASLDELRRQLGPEPSRWRWGDLHMLTFAHPLGVGPLGRLLNRGGFAVGGDAETVAQSACSTGPSYAATGSTASYRLIVDLADFDRTHAVLATGQSGHPGSCHYDDQMALWRSHRYHPVPFSRGAVLQSSASRLVLRPPGISDAPVGGLRGAGVEPHLQGDGVRSRQPDPLRGEQDGP